MAQNKKLMKIQARVRRNRKKLQKGVWIENGKGKKYNRSKMWKRSKVK
jgi:hypothetical protein